MTELEQFPWLDEVYTRVQKCAAANQLPHALLLSGPAGLSKGVLASELAKALMCTGAEPGQQACGECPSCRHYVGGTHSDYYYVSLELNEKTGKLKTRIGVDQIRQLAAAMNLTCSTGRNRVAIIEPADLMNRESANALLKTLEEPPEHTVIMLLSARPDRLPITIISRCQRFEIAMPPAEQVNHWLKQQGVVSERERHLALVASGGSPGLALALTEEGEIDRVRTLSAQLESIFSGRSDPLAAADSWTDEDLPQLAAWMGLISADLIRCRMSSCDDPGWGDNLLQLSSKANLKALFDARDVFYRAAYEAEGSIRRDLLRDDVFLAWGRCAARTQR